MRVSEIRKISSLVFLDLKWTYFPLQLHCFPVVCILNKQSYHAEILNTQSWGPGGMKICTWGLDIGDKQHLQSGNK